MDPSTTSNIPRLSKLPLPRTSRIPTQSNSFTSDQPFNTSQHSSNPIGPPRAVRTTSTGASAIDSTSRSHAENRKPGKNALLDTAHLQSSAAVSTPRHDMLDSTVLSGSTPAVTAKTEISQAKEGLEPTRKSRPSLSDRTVETLSQIPPSPSPRRRQSGFFTNDSPMQPPSRTASISTFSRPSSRTSSCNVPIRPLGRPESPTKSHGVPKTGIPPTSSTPSRRAVSTYLPRSSVKSSHNAYETLESKSHSEFNVTSPSTSIPTPRTQIKTTLHGSKTIAARPVSVRAPLQSLFKHKGTENPSNPIDSGTELHGTIRNEESPRGHARPKSSGPLAIKPISRKPLKKLPFETGEPPVEELRKFSASSQSLRETIAKAKAAHRAAGSGLTKSASIPRSVEDDQPLLGVSQVDAFSLDLTEHTTVNVLRKRIDIAKTEGKLNIAALGLTEIPEDVLHMYEHNDAGSVAWYETVDLTRLIAADNDITDITAAFTPPGISEHADQEEDAAGGVFAGLEFIDLHGNRVTTIPPVFSSLLRLTTLNLSRNRITCDAISVLSNIHGLRELRIAENALQGQIPDCICKMENLEILDIHENAVSSLPKNFGRLKKLKVLDISGNKFTLLPIEELVQILPLIEIVASRNRLDGTLLPSFPVNFTNLQTLNVSHNAIVSVADHEVKMPSLLSVDLSSNRISRLPEATAWPKLETLIANENQIKALPQDFASLKDLKAVDLSSNSLTKIDDTLASMDRLVTLRLTNNPLHERKLLNMTADELKATLQARLSSPLSETSGGLEAVVHNNIGRPSSLWVVKSGILERSRSKLRELDPAELNTVAAGAEVRSLVLCHNLLQQIHPAITAFENTMVNLDLSHNKLGQNADYLAQSLSLPVLQTLNLTSNALSSLDPLAQYLSAPKLASLNLSFNRITSLPLLHGAFPVLLTLLASNNAIVELDVESVRGLQTLDVSSNEIEHLPPRLALLQGQMRTLMVGGNKFRVPGWGVLEKGTDEILKWCKLRIPAGEEGAVVDEVD
ncbi:hypothetical protein MMC11_002810 [Xylographa trunciseda]|nr:hypothetical protein [Xylographa trunciseda]